MSDWTKISGCVSLEKEPFEYELNKDGSIKFHTRGYYEGTAKKTLPYPEEQTSIIGIEPFHQQGTGRNKKYVLDGFRMRLEITSFPLIKEEVDSLIKDLPSGESEIIEYNLLKDSFHRSSSTEFTSPQIEKIFQEKALKYVHAYSSWKSYTEYTPIELLWEEHQENTTLTILDSVRWCKACDFHVAFIKFLEKLVERDILFDHGSFYYRDDYVSRGVGGEEYFMKIDDDKIDITIFDYKNNTKRREFYQIFGNTKKSEDENKRYPWKKVLKRVNKLTENSWVDLSDATELLEESELLEK